ncbi:2OG-Fe(II) oxygenase [Synechococcus phage ACG-2014j]|jgi:hypothetical protein|uniref:Uncharacterized protein n=1 Tax=Synechococcus phage ACG-2014j TaxID=1493514 RepID=A0A0E3FKE5_9CAUD|nr:2OG-Fe(II) oxygenase [Synechococcus phage ACG-2014j]AIX28389.1 hypothetical protein Syn7803US23_45 [Synechococcus phage ACG-2014j]
MISIVEEFLSEEENDQLAEVALTYSKKYEGRGKFEWQSAGDSPLNSYYLNNIEYPQIVRTFSDRCESTVNKLLEHIKHTCKATEIWYNVYDNTQYQEPHTHGGAIFSLVYFNKLPKGSSKLQFTLDPDECSFHKERTAIFFVGGLEHGVLRGTNVDPRITWSSNYA